jgi:hypothetical protein
LREPISAAEGLAFFALASLAGAPLPLALFGTALRGVHNEK